jgi:hypothetical protein
MRRTTRATATAAAALAAVVGIGTSQASATGATWTVTGGGAITAASGTVVVADSATSFHFSCASSAATGSAPDGTGLTGTTVARLGSASWTGCTGVLGIAYTITPSGLPWDFDAVSYDAATGTTTGTLSGVRASLDGTWCTTGLAGPDGAPATLAASYADATHTLSVSGGDLHADDSPDCLGLINNGDALTLTASYVVTPSALRITSP